MGIKKTVATLGLAATLALGGGTVGQLATAHKAEAAIGSGAGSVKVVSYGSPYRVNLGYGHCAVFMYYDYNWFEEVFQGKHDGAVYQYRVLC
jgi:hypothetical protein